VLLTLEKKRRQLLEDKEEEWRLKRRFRWIQNGDENTKLFQDYAKGRKMENTIWILKDSFGRKITSFEDQAQLGSQHLKKIFIAKGRVTIDVIVQMALLFPRFLEEEYNRSLMEEVSKDKLKEVLHSFQKYKSPGPDGWSIEFFVGLFDLIVKEIIKVVEEYQRNNYIHASLNETFISLIPKKDDPKSLEKFIPISL
jgi:hypothetical protein